LRLPATAALQSMTAHVEPARREGAPLATLDAALATAARAERAPLLSSRDRAPDWRREGEKRAAPPAISDNASAQRRRVVAKTIPFARQGALHIRRLSATLCMRSNAIRSASRSLRPTRIGLPPEGSRQLRLVHNRPSILKKLTNTGIARELTTG
jgi:hypothetical protein